MSKQAEQRSLEVYPVQIDPTACDCDINEVSREIYQLGYEQAEKDIMERAVEIEVWNYSSCTDLRALPLWGIEKFDNLKDGDKVRVIVLLKEEEKITPESSEDTESWPLHRPWSLPEPDADDSYYENNW